MEYSTPPRTRRRRRCLAAVALTAALAVTCAGASSVHATAGLRGPHEPPEFSDGVAHRSPARPLPQHGTQRPRRPPPHSSALAPGHEVAAVAPLAAGLAPALQRELGRVRRGGRGRARDGESEKIKEEMLKHREENMKRKAANQKLRQQKLRQQQKDRDGSSSKKKKAKDAVEDVLSNSKRQKIDKKDKDKDKGRDQKKDKNKDRKDEDKKNEDDDKIKKKGEKDKRDMDDDKNKKDKDKDKGRDQKKDKNKDRKDEDKKDKDDDKIKKKGEKGKRDKDDDKNKKNGEKGREKGKRDEEKGNKDGANKSDGMNRGGNGKKTNEDKRDDNDPSVRKKQASGGRGRKKNKDKDEGDKYDMLLQNGVISTKEANRLTDEEKDTLLLLTDGKFHLDWNDPPKRPEKPILNDGADDGGGTLMSDVSGGRNDWDPSDSPTASPSSKPTPTASPTSKPTSTASPSSKPTPTASPSKPTSTASPTSKPTGAPTAVTPEPTPSPTPEPTTQPISNPPTAPPIPESTPRPTPEPTLSPIPKPTPQPIGQTPQPTPDPTSQPTRNPKNENTLSLGDLDAFSSKYYDDDDDVDDDDDDDVDDDDDTSGAAAATVNDSLSPTLAPTPPPTRRAKATKAPSSPKGAIAALSSSNSNLLSSSLEWNFVAALADTSTPLDGFERASELDWTMPPVDVWAPDTTHVTEGDSAIMSGINRDTYDLPEGAPIYSNLTLTTAADFPGGMLKFMIWARQLELPIEAFFVTVDGEVALTPAMTNRNEVNEGIKGWVEYSVPVGPEVHEVTWSHVHNPFGMPVLPSPDSEVGLWMDDLRYVPFTSNSRVLDLSSVEMTNGRKQSSSWDLVDNEMVALATSSDKKRKDDTDIRFELNSQHGGTLKYKVKTSTTAPHNDFAILLGDELKDAIFGEMLGFEDRRLAVPPGQQLVTLRHRKNPGNFGQALLNGLGEPETDGKTWLKDLSFEQNNV